MPQQARKNGPVTIAMVGAGPRAVEYAQIIVKMPEKLKIVAVVNRNAEHRHALADAHGVPKENRFASHDELAARPGLADAVINTTADPVHYASSMPLFNAGYHMLLEKPITRTEKELRDLIAASRKNNCITMICHGMRYNPLFAKVKELIDAGAIGRVMSMRASENIAYFHLATSLIRHPRNGPENTPLLLYKCCHDLDLLAWYVAPARAIRVSSVGSPSQFYPKNAPEGSSLRCLDGCKVEEACPYSARKIYVQDHEWDDCAWPHGDYRNGMPNDDQKLQILKTTSPYGRCVWHCPHHAVDHQGVLIEFGNGVTATFDMVCGTPRGWRTLQVLGTHGEIDVNTIGSKLLLRKPSGAAQMSEEQIPVQTSHGQVTGHWLTEWKMLEGFADAIASGNADNAPTRIEESLTGHQIAYAADISMHEGRTVTVEP